MASHTATEAEEGSRPLSGDANSSAERKPTWSQLEGVRLRKLLDEKYAKEHAAGKPVDKLVPEFVDGFFYAAHLAEKRIRKEDVTTFWPAVSKESLNHFYHGLIAVREEIVDAWLEKHDPDKYRAQQPHSPTPTSGRSRTSTNHVADDSGQERNDVASCAKSASPHSPTPSADPVPRPSVRTSPTLHASSGDPQSKRKAADCESVSPKTKSSKHSGEEVEASPSPEPQHDKGISATTTGQKTPKRSGRGNTKPLRRASPARPPRNLRSRPNKR